MSAHLRSLQDGSIPLFLAAEAGNTSICRELLQMHEEHQINVHKFVSNLLYHLYPCQKLYTNFCYFFALKSFTAVLTSLVYNEYTFPMIIFFCKWDQVYLNLMFKDVESNHVKKMRICSCL